MNTTNSTSTNAITLPFNVGKFVATVLVTFITSNIDDVVILMNFFTVATMRGSALKSIHVFIGQYLGFGLILALSLAGFGLAFVVPIEFLGFLGFLPIFLGLKGIYELIYENDPVAELQNILPMCEVSTVELRSVRRRNSNTNNQDTNNGSQTMRNQITDQRPTVNRWRRLLNTLKQAFFSLQILKVASITLANGSDNIAIYSALFAQAQKWQISLYIGSYLLLVLILLLLCYFFINFRPILTVAQKYAHYVVPFAFIGIGIYIIVTSHCFPWLASAIKTNNFRNG